MFVPRNIVVLFDKKFSEELIMLSQKLHSVIPSAIILNTKDMLPHMTVYTTNFPEENEEKVKEHLGRIAQRVTPFDVAFTTPVIDMLGVWINAEPTDTLQNFHNTIVEALNPYRNGLYDEKELVAIGNNKARQESLVKYGMWAAKDLYIPHITLSRPIDASLLEESLALLPKHTDYTTTITEVAYVERGPYGTCKSILEKFPLVV